jgi:hypothetical protein
MSVEMQRSLAALARAAEGVFDVLETSLEDGRSLEMAKIKIEECVQWANQGIIQKGLRKQEIAAEEEKDGTEH